jgi:hypothetical protein
MIALPPAAMTSGFFCRKCHFDGLDSLWNKALMRMARSLLITLPKHIGMGKSRADHWQ